MKAITLHQPWATFIAEGWKTLETRSWATSCRGRIAIHAAKRLATPYDCSLISHRMTELPVRERVSITPASKYPLGVIVAVADLTDCILMRPESVCMIPRLDWIMGNFHPGRYAWKLENVRALDPPVPARRRQGLWNWDEGAG